LIQLVSVGVHVRLRIWVINFCLRLVALHDFSFQVVNGTAACSRITKVPDI
jgi:hypothetical protein